jgi:hypothetical protein
VLVRDEYSLFSMTLSCYSTGGQGRGRTADLPLFQADGSTRSVTVYQHTATVACKAAPKHATRQAGQFRPPRWTIVLAESTESRPSPLARVASRAWTRRPRPRAGSYEEYGETQGTQSSPYRSHGLRLGA